jgi:hypothetical protein
MKTDLLFLNSNTQLVPSYFAMQTFLGSVKKPAFAKATARQAQRFAR